MAYHVTTSPYKGGQPISEPIRRSCGLKLARIVLITGCVLYMVAQFWGATLFTYKSALQPSQSGTISFANTLETLVVFAVYGAGAYGAYSRRRVYLIVFACVTASMAIIVLISLAVTSNQEIEKDMRDALESTMANYRWGAIDMRLGHEEFIDRFWNNLQQTGCCGIDGPADWDKYRPHNFAPDELPPSCCYMGSGPRSCNMSRIMSPRGCMVNMKLLVFVVIRAMAALNGFMLLLATLAGIMARWDHEDPPRRSSSSASSTMHQPAPHQTGLNTNSASIGKPPAYATSPHV